WGRRDVAGIRRAFRDVAMATSLYTLLLVAPLCLLLRHWLVAPLAQSALAAQLAEKALLVCPLACLVAIPFFACRPIFDGMQRPVPGLVVAGLRYVLLTVPFAFGGAAVADRFGRPEVHGIVVGLVVATAISSSVFLAWMWRALARLEATRGAEASAR